VHSSATPARALARSAATGLALQRIRAACSHVPNVTADPLPHRGPALDIVASVRFNTTRASDANVAELESCLAKFPAAAGIDPEDSSDSGG